MDVEKVCASDTNSKKHPHFPRRSFHLFRACGRKSREITALSANKIFFLAL